MANTLFDLQPVIQATALNAVGNRLAFIKDFATDLTDEVIDPRKTSVTVPFMSGGSTTILNPTTFGGGTTGNTKVTVAMDHVHQPFYITNAEYQNGYKLEQLIEINVQSLVNKIQALAFAPINSTNYGVAFTQAEAGFTSTHLQSAYAAVAGTDKVLYLSTTPFSKLLSNQNTVIDPLLGIPMAGFRKVASFDSTTGLGANTYGFVASGRGGIALASGIPGIAPKAQAMIESVSIDLGNGLTCVLNTWGDTSDRSDNASLDLYFGAAKADPNAIKVIKSA
jgi:hypothetical protein